MEQPAARSPSVVPPRLVIPVAGLTAGAILALLVMVLEWTADRADGGFWAFPLYVGATFVRSYQYEPYSGFAFLPVSLGLLAHFVLAVGLAAPFIALVERLGPGRWLQRALGVGYGLLVFVLMWSVALPFASPVVLRLDPTLFAAGHVVWGLALSALTPAASTARSAVRVPEATGPGRTAARASRLEPLYVSSRSWAHDPARADPAPADLEDAGWAGASAVGPGPSVGAQAADGADARSAVEEVPAPDDPAPMPEQPVAARSAGAAERENLAAPVPTPATARSAGPALISRTAARRLAQLGREVPPPSPVQSALGAQLARVDVGRAMVLMDANETMHNGAGSVQGGTIAALAEVAAGFAIDTLAAAGRAYKLLDHDMHHLNRVSRARLIAEARVVEQDGASLRADVSVRTDDGTPVARSRVTALML